MTWWRNANEHFHQVKFYSVEQKVTLLSRAASCVPEKSKWKEEEKHHLADFFMERIKGGKAITESAITNYLEGRGLQKSVPAARAQLQILKKYDVYVMLSATYGLRVGPVTYGLQDLFMNMWCIQYAHVCDTDTGWVRKEFSLLWIHWKVTHPTTENVSESSLQSGGGENKNRGGEAYLPNETNCWCFLYDYSIG